MKVNYEDLKQLKEFEPSKDGIRWQADTIDHFMGFTRLIILATEGEDGNAKITYAEKYCMSRDYPQETCTDEKYIGYMNTNLEELLKANNIQYTKQD